MLKKVFCKTVLVSSMMLGISVYAIANTTDGQLAETSVIITGNFKEGTKVSGLVFDNRFASEVNTTKVVKLDEKHLIAFFKVNTTNFSSRISLTAVANDSNGKLRFGTIKNFSPEIINESYLTAIPMCEPAEADLNMQTQLSVLEKLVRLRAKMRANQQNQVKQVLTNELLNRLAKTESSFGLEYPTEIQNVVNPFELFERLYRVYHVLRNYRLEHK